jgi:hypothetical protein
MGMALERKNSAFSLFTPKSHHFGWERNSCIACPASFLASYPTEPVPEHHISASTNIPYSIYITPLFSILVSHKMAAMSPSNKSTSPH